MAYIKYNVNMKKLRKKMGRPPKAAGEKQSERVVMRVTKAEKQRLKAEARKKGLSISGLLLRSWREKQGD